MKQRLIDKFQEIYGEDGPVSVYFAPGRVNLIGDHTDIMAGMCLPARLLLEPMQWREKEKITAFGSIL